MRRQRGVEVGGRGLGGGSQRMLLTGVRLETGCGGRKTVGHGNGRQGMEKAMGMDVGDG